jgi:NADPH2:quinone reductase
MVASGLQHGRVGGVGARLGLECAGEIEAVGSEVVGLKPGDRVMGSAPGGYAEYAVTDWGRVSRIPANNMTFAQAACLPVALQTMHNAVVTNAGRRARLAEFGCDVALDSSDPDWPAAAKAATGGKGADLIVDLVSGSAANQNLEAAALLGRMVNVGRLGGMTGAFNFDLHALKRIDYIGVTFRTRSPGEVREIVRLMRADLWDAVEAGKLALPIDRTFPLEEIAQALTVMRANQHFGKIVVMVG